MALLQELDLGTPIRTGEATVTLTIDGRQCQRAARNVGHGGGGDARELDPEALRDRQPRGIRLLPPLPRRDRGPQRYAGLVHDSRRSREWSSTPERPASSVCGGG